MLRIDPGLKAIVERQVAQRRARQGEPTRPVTTVKSKALFDLQFRATVEGHSFISDERETSGGHDAGPAPLRYFLGGIMMCHQVWCVKSAVLAGVELHGLEAEIAGYVGGGSGQDEKEVGGGFARITYQVTVDSPDSADRVRSIVDQACRRCAAFVTAARGTRIDVTVIHNGNNAGELTYGQKRS